MCRAALVLSLIGVLVAFGVARTAESDLVMIIVTDAPPVSARLDDDTRTYLIETWGGIPGGVGAVNIFVVVGSETSVMTVPFQFDANGEYRVNLPYGGLFQIDSDVLVGVQVVTLNDDSSLNVFPLWILQSHHYVVTEPGVSPCPTCPAEPGYWVAYVPWPGETGGPLYPVTAVAAPTEPMRADGQPMLAIQSGPAGSFPIN